MAIANMDAVPRVSHQYSARNIYAGKVVGTGLVALLADVLDGYDVALVTALAGALRIVVQAQSPTAVCPACLQMSTEVHSRYWRTPSDVTPFGLHLQLQVYARRFRCRNPECQQRVFAERLPDIPAWGRRSDRISTLLAYTALSVGGLPGRRVARLYGFAYSRHTLLRAARQVVADSPKAIEVLGVDDYAYRRGVNYGTLLYDFTERKVVDLLPGRSAEFLAAWLRAHPGVKVISRDRGGSYAQGAREGAPQAIQVADRFHLLQNLGDCLERIAQKGIRLPTTTPATDPPPDPTPIQPRLTRVEEAKAATRLRRRDRQDTIRDLFQQGASISAIAATLHIGRHTVRRYLRSVPDNARSCIVDPYAEYLRRRWNEGEHNGRTLLAEIRAKGYTGSQTILYVFLQPWRAHGAARRGASALRAAPQTVSPRAFRRLVLKKARTPDEESLLASIASSDPSLAMSISLAHEFARTVREHDASAFDVWLGTATDAGLPDWKAFADSLRRDIDAVHNGITLQWSQGPVEGSIHRLKLIKRAMYGRGGHDLLRRRVIFHLPS